MRVAFKLEKELRHTTVIGTPGEYDAIPLMDIRFLATAQVQNLDRRAVAAALFFHDKASGELVFEDGAACSRHVALEIARLFSPVDLAVYPQSLTPVAIPAGVVTAYMPFFRPDETSILPSRRGEMTLRFLGEAVGALFSEREVTIGSTLPSRFESLDDSVSDVLRHLGAAMLFADDFQLGKIVLGGGEWHSERALRKLEAARRLLSAVGVGLSWAGAQKMLKTG